MDFIQIDWQYIGGLALGNVGAIVFVVGTVLLLEFVGFLNTGDRRRLAVVGASVVAAVLWTAQVLYPPIQAILTVLVRAYLFVVFSPVLYEFGRALVNQVRSQNDGG